MGFSFSLAEYTKGIMRTYYKEIIMTLRREMIAFAVRLLTPEASVRKPEPLEAWLNNLFGIESRDQRMAREIDESLDLVAAAVKRAKLNRDFKKIVRNV
jgi:hypothetical protein